MVHLYQKGTEREIRGLMCDVQKINPRRFSGELPEGWFFSPEEAHEEVKTETKKDSKTEEAEEKKTDEVLTGNAKIRNDAKDAGLEDWETARITTLEKKLKA